MSLSFFLRPSCLLHKGRKLLFQYDVKLLRCQLYSSSKADSQWPDLSEICRTGQIPPKFNFATHVFQKHVATVGTETALWFDDDINERKISYEELNTESIRTALAIQKILVDTPTEAAKSPALNIPPIALTILPRIPEWWFVHLGCIRSRTVFCPATILLTPADIQFRLETSQPAIIITDEKNMEKVDEAESMLQNSKSFKKVVVGKNVKKGAGWLSYEDLVADVKPQEVSQFRDVETKAEDISLIFFTSGTTGSPKMVAHSFSSYGIGHYKTSDAFQLQPTDIIWSPTDTGWAKCSYCSFYAPFITGCTVYIKPLPKLEPKKALEVLRSKPITVFFSTPTFYRSMLQVKDDGTGLFQPQALRLAVGGSEAVVPEDIRLWKEKTGMTMNVSFGQTETTTMGSSGDLYPQGGSFEPSKQYDIRIVGKEGEELEVGKTGNIAIKIKPQRPVGLFPGYLSGGKDGIAWDEKKNKSCFVGDFYLTGDRGYADKQGNIFYVSRADDVIISAGYRIGPFEVESALQTHPAVIESAVVASPDPLRGEVVKAFIVIEDKVQYSKNFDKRKLITELQEHVKKHTAPYKYPRKVEFVDSLPKTVSGKILRRELKEQEFS